MRCSVYGTHKRMKSRPTNGDNAQKKRGKNILNNVLENIFPVIVDIE